MKQPSLSWIDRSSWTTWMESARPSVEVGPVTRKLVRVAPTAKVEEPPPTVPLPRQSVSPPRPSVPTQSAPAPLVAVPPPSRVTSTFHPPAAALEVRLHAVVEWIEENVSCIGAFIADDNGLPVVEHSSVDQGHMAAASSVLLMLASIRGLMGDVAGWLSLKTGAGVLHFVEVETEWGRFGVGILTHAHLPSELLPTLRDAVEVAFTSEAKEST